MSGISAPLLVALDSASAAWITLAISRSNLQPPSKLHRDPNLFA